jgi:putative ABC transport system permease protein
VPVNDAAWMRARALWRRHRTAGVIIGIVAGLAAAIPMTAWTVARRTDRALPEFLASAGVPDLELFACPPGYRPEVADPGLDGEAGWEPCWGAPAPPDLHELAELPEIEAVGATSFLTGNLRLPGAERPMLVGMYADHDPTAPPTHAGGLVLEGRLPSPDAPLEFALGEWAARRVGAELGDTVGFQPFPADDEQCASGMGCANAGPPLTLELVGIIRTPMDLASTRPDEGATFLSAGFWDAYDAEQFHSYGTAIMLWLSPGTTADDAAAAIASQWSDRGLQLDPAGFDQVRALPLAISYQVGAAELFAVVSALAAAIVVGQVVVRQTRRERADDPVLVMLGATTRDLRRAAVLRALPTAVIAAAVATVASIAASPVGPVGIARATTAGPTWRVDALVSAIGACSIGGLVMVAGLVPAARRPTSRPARQMRPVRSDPGASASLGLGVLSLRPTVLTGLRAAVRGHGGGAVSLATAIATSAVAVAAVITAGTVLSNLGDLVDDPPSFGAPWDLVVGNNSTPEDEVLSFELVREVDGIDAASAIMSTEGRVDGQDLPIMALSAVPGIRPLPPTVTDGRAPTAPGELALGRTSMERLGAGIGDRLEIEVVDVPSGPLEVTIVGEVVLNDGFGADAGVGGLVDAEWARATSPSAIAQSIGVHLDPTADAAEVRGRLDERFDADFVIDPYPSTQIRNLERVDQAALLLAVVIAVLTTAALVHALLVSVRARRRELATLATIGFTPRQLWASVAWQATAVASIALAIGIPLGFVGGRWGWWAVTRAVGVSVTVHPVPWVVVAAAAGLLAIANLAATPGAVVARRRPSAALRVE